MKHPDKTEEYLAAFFKQLKIEEQEESPSFTAIYEQAAIKQQRRRVLRYIGLGVLLLAIILGAWQYEKHFNSPDKEIPVIRASTNYYASLMKYGKIVTNDIHFEYNDIRIKAESEVIIHDLAKMMKKHPSIRLSIEGHTDNTGSAEYNLMLSDARSAEVKQALVDLGIEENRLLSNGFGEEKPAYSNETEVGRKLNRRVEFVLLDK